MINLLTDRACAAKPTKPVEKRGDGAGLYLLVKQREETVSRVWQFEYSRPNQLNDKGRKKRNVLGFGSYPEVTLDDAREERRKARDLIRQGKDPGQEKQQTLVTQIAKGTTFTAVSDDFFQTQIVAKGKREGTVRRYRFLKVELEAQFGARPIGDIKVIEVKDYLQGIVDGGLPEKAQRLRNYLARVFDRAVNLDLCLINPAARLRGEWDKPTVTPFPFIKCPVRLGKLLRDIRDYKHNVLAISAVEMMAMTFPRPANIAAMKWSDINVGNAVWSIGAAEMKMKRPHLVPLSRQALAILERLKPLTGQTKYVFTVNNLPLPYDAMLRCLASTGTTSEEHVPHGFRKTASTLLNEEMHWHAPAIELQLAHARPKGQSKVAAIYDEAEYIDTRRVFMQHWSDRLDAMREERDGANVLPLIKAA